jgi:hypothetical protein
MREKQEHGVEGLCQDRLRDGGVYVRIGRVGAEIYSPARPMRRYMPYLVEILSIVCHFCGF